MSVPTKALQLSQLQLLTAGSAVPASGHQVFKASFLDNDNQIKIGYYKPLSDDYPELLAKYSVATSVIMRLSLAERVAEDRLVFDDEGNIIGTFSIAIPDFEPFLCSGEADPEAPKKERVCPSVQTLLINNIAELLVGLWRIKEDDAHPGNLSLKGIIDPDMRLYSWFSCLKGLRITQKLRLTDSFCVQELPEKTLSLESSHLDNFPILPGRATHWPTNDTPGNYYLKKTYKSVGAFQELATNPSMETEQGVVSFQDQLFKALLKELLSFDPDMLESQLFEYFGDLPLNFLTLSPSKSEKLSQKDKDLFNSETDGQPFVQNLINLFKKEYNDFYLAVVFYSGCKANNKGVSVPSFNEYIRSKPSFYRDIKEWMIEQNASMKGSWQESGSYFNLDKVEHRYHQIWRDAHICYFKEYISNLNTIASALSLELGIDPLNKITETPVSSAETQVTSAWQMLDIQAIKNSVPINDESDNDLKVGLFLLIQYINEMVECTQSYYHVDRESLLDAINWDFCEKANTLSQKYQMPILQKLSSSELSSEFAEVSLKLQSFFTLFNLQFHCKAKDKPIESIKASNVSQPLIRVHTDDEVMKNALITLFDWAAGLSSNALESYIISVIQTEYLPSEFNLLTTRTRADEILQYLKVNKEESSDNKLAYIFSTGGVESTSLNTLLITYLMPLAIENTLENIGIDLRSVHEAFKCRVFDSDSYAQYAQKFVKTNQRFTNLYSDRSAKLFNDTLYQWVGRLKYADFKKDMEKLIKDYTPSSYGIRFWAGTRTRMDELKGYLAANLNSSQIVASVFYYADKPDGSFNTKLLKKLIHDIQRAIPKMEPLGNDAGYSLISTIDIENESQLKHFLGTLKKYAKAHIPQTQMAKLNLV